MKRPDVGLGPVLRRRDDFYWQWGGGQEGLKAEMALTLVGEGWHEDTGEKVLQDRCGEQHE